MCSDFSGDETESEVSCIGNDDESSEEDSDEKIMTRQAPLTCSNYNAEKTE
jgi:hypothetical protein